MINIFRQFRWQLTLSYTLVTVCALLVITLILGGIVFTRIFIPNNVLTPPGLIAIFTQQSGPLLSYILSQSPVDTELIRLLFENPSGTITGFDFLQVGNIQLSIKTFASMRAYVIGADGILLGISNPYYLPATAIGKPFDVTKVQGSEGPINAALAGVTDPQRLYTELEADNRLLLAIPVFNRTSGDKPRLVGVVVIIFDAIPTKSAIPYNLLQIAGRSLIIFLLATGIMGAIFGGFFSNGLATRFKRLATATDRWSEGDFSYYIADETGDEIAQFARRLNDMARQLQSLLRRRQEMAVSEERNRLARDLHDSAKQQALAASLELGTALTLYERDPISAKNHLVEADTLVDTVRKELTNLVHELRPQALDGQDFSEILKEYAIEWSHRSDIELNINIKGNDELPLETRETLFRIAQEALANVARHSGASAADVILDYGINNVTLAIKDNGHGFDTSMPHSGLGLASMHERAEASGGSLTVESTPGQGTLVSVTLPIE